MDRPGPARLRELTLEEREDAQDLRAVIAAALAATPIDVESLRRGVWTYVRSERGMGTPPATVISALTELVEASPVQPRVARDVTVRQMILWSVEAYFGYLGGEVVGDGAGPARTVAPAPPMIVSNR